MFDLHSCILFHKSHVGNWEIWSWMENNGREKTNEKEKRWIEKKLRWIYSFLHAKAHIVTSQILHSIYLCVVLYYIWTSSVCFSNRPLIGLFCWDLCQKVIIKPYLLCATNIKLISPFSNSNSSISSIIPLARLCIWDSFEFRTMHFRHCKLLLLLSLLLKHHCISIFGI